MAGYIHVAALLALAFIAAKYRLRQRAGNGFGPSLVPLIAALLIVVAAGCGNRPETPVAQTRTSQTSTPTQFERSMTTWKSGDKEAAVRAFLEMDLSKPLFAVGAPLGNSEAQFMVLPTAGRERIGVEILTDLQIIKEIAARVGEMGREAKAKGDAGTARKCVEQIKQLGEQIDKPSSTVIAQKVGQALKRMAVKDQ